ncbi:hypothetical protein AbraIFM66951_007744 [Aspergillus brasiliensis]|nr:hypothetical protein AbraIFM66951_007744 [Aspergillus brasiliensis]
MQAAGGNPFIANRRGRTPLIQAIKDSRIDIVNLLLDSGERVAVASDENQIRESALEGSKGVFELLLDREPSLWTSKALESSLLMYTAKLLSCVSNTNNWKAISRILKLVRSGRTKINVSIRKDSPLGPTPLHNVCLDTYHGAWSSGIIRLLLEAGADVDIPDNRGRTPIHNILSTTRDAQDRELILTMIKSSQNIDQLDHEGRSYLHPAAGRNHPRTVQLLLSKMSKDTVFAVMEDGKTALHSAAISGNTSIIQQLLAAGFDVNVKGWKGQTPLHYASQSRNTTSKASCIALLAEAGADMNILDDDGIPPIHDAATSRREDVIEIFLSKGASGHADCEICDQGINATRRWMYCEYYV